MVKALPLIRDGYIQAAQNEDIQDSETEELTAYFDDDDDDENGIMTEEGKGTVKSHDISDFTHGVLGTVDRKIRMKQQREPHDDLDDVDSEDEYVVFKRRKLAKPHLSRRKARQAVPLRGKIRARSIHMIGVTLKEFKTRE